MKKSDLKDGMILVTRARGNGILLAGCLKGSKDLYSSGGILKIDSLNDNLSYEVKGKIYKNILNYSIDKVYKISNMNNKSLSEIIDYLPEDSVELIWERKREIDWSKVPKLTKVIINDYESSFGEERFFIAYEPKLKDYPFITITDLKEGLAGSYKYCRIHPDVKIQDDWYKEDDGAVG